MDDKSLEILEFPHIREILAGFTVFSSSRELALDIHPLSDYEQISLLLGQSAEEEATHSGTTIEGHLIFQAQHKEVDYGLSPKWLKYQIDTLIHTLPKTPYCKAPLFVTCHRGQTQAPVLGIGMSN